ncbi:MAG TPA: type II secretion system protein GspC [Steroidobacteraceae bacterium]|jgi:general secretion pathway protein C
MLDTRTNEWLSRVQANAPKLVTLLLAALIAVEIGRIAITFLSKPVVTPQPLANNAPVHMRNQGLNVQTIVNAHPFGTAAVEVNTNEGNAPPSSANLQLAGTIATQNPKKGVALISDGGSPTKVYAVGDNIGGASLYSVYLDHVILDRSGSLETLSLPRLTATTAPVTRRMPPAANPRTAAAVESIRSMVQKDPSILDQVMRTVPSYDNSQGKLRGFRAYPGRNRQIFAKLGLKSGDLVTAINGTPLDDPQHSQDVFNTIQSSDHVTVTVERGGEKQDITLNIAQVAAQATSELEGTGSGQNPNGIQPEAQDAHH